MSKANPTPEQAMRVIIDKMLSQAGWVVQDKKRTRPCRRALPLRRQSEQADHVQGSEAPRHRAGLARPSGLPPYARPRRRRDRVRVTPGSRWSRLPDRRGSTEPCPPISAHFPVYF